MTVQMRKILDKVTRHQVTKSPKSFLGDLVAGVLVTIVCLFTTIAYADDLSSGLIGWWPLNEGSGTTANDRSGNANTGTLNNGPSWTTGLYGSTALSFDGSNDDITTPTGYSNPSDFSLSVWFNTSTASGHKIIGFEDSSSSTGSSSYDRMIWMGSNGYIYFGCYNGGVNVIPSSSTLNDGNWHHAVSTSSNGSHSLYIDGVYQGSLSSACQNYFGYLHIGGYKLNSWPNGGDGFFTGKLSEARLYNRAISASEVQKLYYLTQGLILHWTLDDGAGSTATDVSYNGNDGTLNNSPSWVTGKISNGVQFDGTNESITKTGAANYTSEDFSLSAWVYANTLVDLNNGPVIIDKGAYQNYGYYVQLMTTGSICFATDQSGAHQGSCSADGVFKTGSWHHIAITRSGASASVYYDGQDVTSVHATHINPASSSDPFTVGKYYSNNNDSLDGIMDDVRVYNHALSSTAVEQLYRLNVPPSGGLWNLDEGSGTSAFDSSGNGLTGTLVNTPTWDTGEIDGALTFSQASSEYVTMGDVLDMDAAQSFSVSFWAKYGTQNGSNNFPGTVCKASHNNIRGYCFLINTTGGADDNKMGFQIDDASDNTAYVYSQAAMNDSAWHHYVGVVDRSNQLLSFYVDGTLQGTSSTSSVGDLTNSEALLLGARKDTTQLNYLTGSIDKVKIYNRAISSTEIGTVYNADRVQLVGWWEFNDGSGNEAVDSSGNEHTVQLYGGPSWTTGKVGSGALSVSGGQYGNLPGSLITTPISYSVWFKTSSEGVILGDSNQGPFSGPGRYNPFLYVRSDGKLSAFTYNGGLGVILSSGTVDDGQWHHAVYIKASGTQYLYLDGTYVGSASDAAQETFSFQAGTGYTSGWPSANGGWYSFDGQIDDLRIYHRVLTISEITFLSGNTLTKGLVGWWKLDDGAGTSATDSSGYSNTGTLTNGPAWTNGKIKSGVSFDGSDDYITIGTSQLVANSSSSTVSAWVKTQTVADAWVYAENASGVVWGLNVASSGNAVFQIYNSGVWKLATSSGLVNTGNWVHLVGVLDGSAGMKIYVNGALVGSDASTLSSNGTIDKVEIGRVTNGGGLAYFNGLIDDVRIYNRALGVEEIWQLYKFGARSGFYGAE